MSLKLDLVFDAVTGDLLETVGAPRALAVNPVTAKLQPNLPVRVRLVDRTTGNLVAAAGGIKIGFKPLGHYSDALFDLYADNFVPVGASGDDLLTYETTMVANGPDLAALFAPNGAGVSPDSVDLIGEVKIGTVPTATFRLQATNNVIKGDEPPVSPGSVRSLGSLNLGRLNTPEAPGVTVRGATGDANWKYRIVACLADGTTTDAGVESFLISTGNSTLSPTNYNELTWPPVAGAASYQVYRTNTSASVTPATLGKIGTTSVPRFFDTGAAGDGSAFPTFNATGGINFLHYGASVLFLYANNAHALALRGSDGTEVAVGDVTLAGNNAFTQINTFPAITSTNGDDWAINADGSGVFCYAQLEWDANGNFGASRVISRAGIGAFGTAPPTTRPATPTNLAQVIAVLQGAGFCA